MQQYKEQQKHKSFVINDIFGLEQIISAMELKVNIFLPFTSSHFSYNGAPFNSQSQSPHPRKATSKLAYKSSALLGSSCREDFRERLDPVEAHRGHRRWLQSWVPLLQNTLQNQGLWDSQPSMKPIAKASFIVVFVTNSFIIFPQQCQ